MLASIVAAVVLTASAPAGRTFSVAEGSTLAYRLVHRFHAVNGVSHAVEGKARVLDDGTVQVMVRAPLQSFDSGDANRDANMLEATDAARNPYVLLKAVGRLEPPASLPAEIHVVLRGELTLKTPRPIELPLTVSFDSPDRAHVDVAFPISLEDHAVERPSLLFVKVDDRVEIHARLALEAER